MIVESVLYKSEDTRKLVGAMRGIAIFFVVFGHMITSDSLVFRYINSMHLPLFFMISGYLLYGSLERYSVTCFLKKKCQRLLIPFFTWSFVAFAARVIFVIIKTGAFPLTGLYEPFFYTFVCAQSAWFLLVLFFGCFMIALCKYYVKYKLIIIMIIMGLYYILPNSILSFGKLKVSLPLIFLGYVVKKYDIIKKIVQLKSYPYIFIGIPCIFLGLLLCIYNKNEFIAYTEFNLPIYSYIHVYIYYTVLRILGATSLAIITKLLTNIPILAKILNDVGDVSLDVYMQHMFFVEYIPILDLLYNFSGYALYVLIGIYAIGVVLVCCYLTKMILYKIRIYRILFSGQKGN